MKVLGIINKSLTGINTYKYRKMSDDSLSGLASSAIKKYGKNNIYYNDRGLLNSRDLSLANGLKSEISNMLGVRFSKNAESRKKFSYYDRLFNSPDNILALKVDNANIIAISGEVKTIGDEKHLNIIVHGFLGDKKRFLINEEGEIVKKASAKFFSTDSKTRANDTDTIYYSQHEINNLDVRRYMNIFNDEIKKFKEYMITIKPAKIEMTAEEISKYSSFIFNQRKSLDSISNKFNKLYKGILNHSHNGTQKKTLLDICGVRLHKKFPLMQIDNINSKNESVLINFTNIGKKTVVRINVQDGENKTNRLFVNGQLVEESTRAGNNANPFNVGKIVRYHTPNETEEFKIPELLEQIDERLTSSLEQLKIALETPNK